MTTFAIIPARMGSKRFPGKNMALLGGKPLVQWAIEMAQQSGVCDEVVVSSESDEVLRLAEQRGAVAHRRCGKASEYAMAVPDVCRDVLRRFDADTAVILLPTSPLRTPEMIRDAHRMYRQGAVCVMSVVPYEHPPQWAVAQSPDGCLRPLQPRSIKQPHDSLTSAYRHDGTVIVCRAGLLRRGVDFYAMEPIAYHVLRAQSVDINEPNDLAWAEFLWRKQHPHEPTPEAWRLQWVGARQEAERIKGVLKAD